MYSNLEAIDFGRLYSVQRVASTHKIKDKHTWDKKAENMNKKVHNSFYNEMVQSNIILNKEETLLDIGCGPGTFSLRFASSVKHVYASDFSQKMIEILQENQKAKGIDNITSFVHDMEKSWDDMPTCDIVLASRCLEVEDIEDVLKKINNHAKKAVYLTYKVGKSYLDEQVLQAIGREIMPKPDYIYLINVLYNMGINAELKFIDPNEKELVNVDSEEEYIESIRWSLDGINEDEITKARKFYQECLQKGLTPPLRDGRWALISWKK